LSDNTVAKFDHVGLNWKYVVVCCCAFFSARSTIHTMGNSEKTNQKINPTSAATDPALSRFRPGRSSLLVNVNAMVL
jgi:hypothetical protein